MVSYEKSVAMKEKAVQDYLDKKIGDSEFILKLKKAGFGELKAKKILDQTVLKSLTYKPASAKRAEDRAANAQAKAEAKATEAKDIAERTAKADAIKKANGDVPSVDEVMMRPLKGKPVIGGTGPHKPATHDKKPIDTVKDVEDNYDPESAILGRTGPAKGAKRGTTRKAAAKPVKVSSGRAKHDAARAAREEEINKMAGLASIYTEDIIEEGRKIKSRGLSNETKKYYDFVMKKLPKYKEKAEDKEKFKSIYNELKSRSTELKKIYDKASKIEDKFLLSRDPKERRNFKKEYKELGKKSKEILSKSKKEHDRLRNLLIAGGMTAATAAGIFAAVDIYDDYMHSFMRLMYELAYHTNQESTMDRMGQAAIWKLDKMLREEVNYFPY